MGNLPFEMIYLFAKGFANKCDMFAFGKRDINGGRKPPFVIYSADGGMFEKDVDIRQRLFQQGQKDSTFLRKSRSRF